MDYKAKETEFRALEEALKLVAEGLGLFLIECTVSRHKGAVNVRLVLYKKGAPLGIEDCARFHRAATPRIELEFGQDNLQVEVSSAGIERQIKNGAEFACYTGEGVRFWVRGADDWKEGILVSADDAQIVIEGRNGMESFSLEKIAKARIWQGESGKSGGRAKKTKEGR